MSAYLDSSALAKLYVSEPESARVAAYARSLGHALPFTRLHALELRNALRLKVFRGEARVETVKASVKLIDDDLAAGVLERVRLDWEDTFARAEELSSQYTATLGSRSLDLLHLAAALLLGATEFATFDERQASLGSKVGLKRARV